MVYIIALRPLLVKHHILPLSQLPATLARHFQNRGAIRLSDNEFDEDATERSDIFEGFRDDDEDEDAEEMSGEVDLERGRGRGYRDEPEEGETTEERERGDVPLGRIGRA